ncbi:MAG: hypothetical protein HQK53_09975 [Oligoflexia bacterium]|nr:hypothetical protein [Oligoflexia bacterium]
MDNNENNSKTISVVISGVGFLSGTNENLITDDCLKKYIRTKDLRITPRISQIGAAAARLALLNAKLIEEESGNFHEELASFYPPYRRAIFLASPPTTCNIDELFPAFEYWPRDKHFNLSELNDYWRLGAKKIFPLWLIRGLSNNLLGQLSIRYQFKGDNLNFTNGSESWLSAFKTASWSIRENRSDLVLVGIFDSSYDWFLKNEKKICAVTGPIGELKDEGGLFVILEREDLLKLRKRQN